MFTLTETVQHPQLETRNHPCETCQRKQLVCHHIDVSQMAIKFLEIESAKANSGFLNGRFSDTRFGFELFRRALEEHNEEAWCALLRVYHSLVIGWVRSHPNFQFHNEEAAYFVNRAFERLWRNIALKAGKFDKFSELKAILRFLKMCTHSAVIDDAPHQPASLVPLAETDNGFEDDSVELSVQFDLSPLNKNQFWQLIDAKLQNNEERIVMIGFFYYGMKNREIYAQHPHLFRDTKQIANLRLNVLRRLGRMPQLKGYLQDLIDDSEYYPQQGFSC